MPGSLIQNEDAVSIQIGYIISLVILIIFTGGIVTTFYLYSDSSSEKAMRAGFTDLGSVIARDITNMYLTSENSKDIVTLNVTRDIPLTIGGKGYRIELNNATQDRLASIDIIESGFSGYRISTTLNSINYPMNTSGVVYSGSGEINIRFKRNESRWLLIN
jgi:hypothetical protein